MLQDSITKQINSAENAQEKLKLYRKYAELFSTKDFSRSIVLSHEGGKLARKLKNTTLEGDFLRLKGNAHYISGKLDSAGSYYYRALSLLKDKNQPKYLAELYNNLGRFYRKTKDFPRALKNYDLALNLYRQLNDTEGIATIYNESGVVYEYLGQHEDAVQRYSKSLEMQKKRGDLVGQGYALEFIGGNYLLQKKYELAEKYLLQSLQLRQKTNDQFALAMNYNVLGHLYMAQNKYSEAEKNFRVSNEISGRLNYLDLQKDNFENLAKIYRIHGDNDAAYESLNKFRIINDSIFSLGKARQIEELSLKYETAEKDRQLLAEKSKVLKRNVLAFSLFGLLLLGFFYYKIYQHKQKITLQREILHQQNLATIAVIKTEDNERKRMATHLHDGIGQLLAAANMNISVLDEYKSDENAFEKILVRTRSILAEAIADARTLSHQIMPNILIKNNLSTALQDLVDKTGSPKLQIDLQLAGLKNNLNQNIQVVLYRTIQECLNNTIKHARATKVSIFVEQTQNSVIAHYADDGVGFDLTAEDGKNGLGLSNIRSRIEILRGTFLLETESGAGVSLTLTIPLEVYGN